MILLRRVTDVDNDDVCDFCRLNLRVSMDPSERAGDKRTAGLLGA
jgi:hypothetical protein